MKNHRNLLFFFVALFGFALTSPLIGLPVVLRTMKKGDKTIIIISNIHCEIVGGEAAYVSIFTDIIDRYATTSDRSRLEREKRVDVLLEMAEGVDYGQFPDFFEINLGKTYARTALKNSRPFNFIQADVRTNAIRSAIGLISMTTPDQRQLRQQYQLQVLKTILAQEMVVSSIARNFERLISPNLMMLLGKTEMVRSYERLTKATLPAIQCCRYLNADNIRTILKVQIDRLRREIRQLAASSSASQSTRQFLEQETRLLRLECSRGVISAAPAPYENLLIDFQSAGKAPYSQSNYFAHMVHDAYLNDLADLGFFTQAMQSQASPNTQATVIICGSAHVTKLYSMFKVMGYITDRRFSKGNYDSKLGQQQMATAQRDGASSFTIPGIIPSEIKSAIEEVTRKHRPISSRRAAL